LGQLAHAQTPAGFTPGAVLDTLPQSRPVMPGTPAQILIPDQPTPSLHDRRGKRFAVHSFRFVGNTAFTSQQLKRVVDRYRDLELNLYQLNVAADAVTEFYRDKGYNLARVVVPPQKVEDGVVTLAVIEGRLGKVLFSGNNRYSAATLRRHTPNMRPGELLTTDKLERSLLLLNDMPGLKVRSTLSPGADFGASDVLVKVEEKPFNLGLTMDNAGRKETGEYRADLNIDINNPLGYGDQLNVRGLLTDQKLLKYKKLGYSLPLDNDGLRLAASYSDVRYDVAGAFAALGMTGSATTSELSLLYPLKRSRGRNEMLSLAYRETRTKQEVLGVETSSTKLPLLVFGYQGNRIGEDASVTNTLLQLASNFKRNSSGGEQDAQLLRVEADINYLLPLNRLWDLYLRGNTVWSHDRLPDSEKMSIGGPGSVRAYRSSEIRGDSGWQGTMEVRRNFSALGRPASVSAFYDAGRAIYKAPGFSDGWSNLQAIGLGFTAWPVGQSMVKLEAATPVGGYEAADDRHTRIWLTFATSF
jgi:hemolysin activation/secretion protein